MNQQPSFADWPFCFVVEKVEDAEAEAEFWMRWLELWNPPRDWLQ